jgi:hypothetical protein
MWNLNANAGSTTVLRVVLPLFSVDLTIILRGTLPRFFVAPYSRSQWSLPSSFVAFVPSWKKPYSKRSKKRRRNTSWVGMPETLNDCDSSRTH